MPCWLSWESYDKPKTLPLSYKCSTIYSFIQPNCSTDLCAPSWEEGTEQETLSALQKFNLVEDKCRWIENYNIERLKASDGWSKKRQQFWVIGNDTTLLYKEIWGKVHRMSREPMRLNDILSQIWFIGLHFSWIITYVFIQILMKTVKWFFKSRYQIRFPRFRAGVFFLPVTSALSYSTLSRIPVNAGVFSQGSGTTCCRLVWGLAEVEP